MTKATSITCVMDNNAPLPERHCFSLFITSYCKPAGLLFLLVC